METICHKTCEENEDIVKTFPSGNLISVNSEGYGWDGYEFPPSYTLDSSLWRLLGGSIPWYLIFKCPWKELNHFGECSNSFKLRSNMCLGPGKYDKKKIGNRVLMCSCFLARDTCRHMSACLNKGHAQFNCKSQSLVEDCSKA